ncbi:MAG TPA: 1-acyl-sn-glycerol-3-phosphate acyltransferase [Synechococcales cyanobacterium M55_K2018_004]|nr:1-acyl-sn-glycerol-3-phosphate acyltransferase [Synechococcales cyanobacterium M55_K2018_004]
MPLIIHHVQPGLKPLPIIFRPWLLRVVHWFVPLLLRVRVRPWLPSGISRIEAKNPEILVDLLAQFQANQIRLILAFRHVEVDDPLCGLYLFSRIIPKTAKRQGVNLKLPLHTHFLYDRGMPLWGGKGLGWILSHIGGISLHRGKTPDWHALKSARRLAVEGTLPMTVAPEGATNGYSEYLGDMEPGVAQLGFWCAEDLMRKGKPPDVWIVPIGLYYTYPRPAWDKLDHLMSQLEHSAGLPPYAQPKAPETRQEDWYKDRLLRLSTHLLEKMEAFYQRFYHCSLVPTPPESRQSGQKDGSDLAPASQSLAPDARSSSLDQRLQTLLDTALRVAESYFGVSSRGTLSERCRRVEEAAWSYIYRADVSQRTALPPLERGLGDWIAAEASLRSLHMRLVESLVSVHENYITEHPSFMRLAETTLLMFDVMARIRGDRYPPRPRLGDRHAHFTICQPIPLHPLLAQYQADRQGAKAAVTQLTQMLQTALQGTLPPST